MEKSVSFNTIASALAALFAALYAVGVIVLAPISFQLFQVRVADALLPLAILFGWPAVVGLSIGCFVANTVGGLGYIDMFGGAVANFVAAFLAWKIGQRAFRGSWFMATLVENAAVTLIVGSYLAYLFGMPITVGFLGVFLGSFVAMNIVGYILLKALARPGILQPLQAKGLKVYMKSAAKVEA